MRQREVAAFLATAVKGEVGRSVSWLPLANSLLCPIPETIQRPGPASFVAAHGYRLQVQIAGGVPCGTANPLLLVVLFLRLLWGIVLVQDGPFHFRNSDFWEQPIRCLAQLCEPS